MAAKSIYSTRTKDFQSIPSSASRSSAQKNDAVVSEEASFESQRNKETTITQQTSSTFITLKSIADQTFVTRQNHTRTYHYGNHQNSFGILWSKCCYV